MEPTPLTLSQSFVMIVLTVVEKLQKTVTPFLGVGLSRFRRPTRFNMGFLWAPSRVNRSNAYRYRKTSPTGPPQFGAGKSIRPLDDHLRRTVTPREGSESLRFRNRTLPSVNGNSRTDGTCKTHTGDRFGLEFACEILRNTEMNFVLIVPSRRTAVPYLKFDVVRKFFEGERKYLGSKIFGAPHFSLPSTS
jgi:hypothetical protein